MAKFINGQSTGLVRVRFFGPLKTASTNPPNVALGGLINSVFTVEQQQFDGAGNPSWVDVTSSFDQYLPGTQGGREIVLRLKSGQPAALQNAATYRVLLPSGQLYCDKLTTTALVPVVLTDGSFTFRVGCLAGGQPNPADVFGGDDNINGQYPDGVVDGDDFINFVNSFAAGEIATNPLADINHDGVIDGSDFVAFINGFSAGCE